MIRLAFRYPSSRFPAPTLLPTSTDAELENPAKKLMMKPSIVLKTARAAMALSLCLPSTAFIVMFPIPRNTSLRMIGKHLTKNSRTFSPTHLKWALNLKMKGYLVTAQQMKIMDRLIPAAATVAIAAPLTPRAGNPRFP